MTFCYTFCDFELIQYFDFDLQMTYQIFFNFGALWVNLCTHPLSPQENLEKRRLWLTIANHVLKPQGACTICLCSRLLFYSKCSGFTDVANYVYKSMINKRWITLPVVYSRPFTSKAVFWAILKEFEFAVDCIRNSQQRNPTPSKLLKKTLLR